MWIDVQQNTEEWEKLREGKVTGSSISKVMAHFGKDFGEPAKRIAVEIALTQITGKAEQSTSFKNEHMERGHEQEPIARQLYESENFCQVTNGGFYDNGITGCSPDGLVGDNGLVEIKSVIRFTQYKTIQKQSYDSAYKWQVMFNLKESKREWLDYISYCEGYPDGHQLFQQRIFAEDCEKYFNDINTRMNEFEQFISNIKQDILKG